MTENTGTIPTPPPPPAPTYQYAPRPPLRRSRTDRVLGGVASGFARWLGIDPVIVRVVIVILAVFGGSGLLLYLLGWLFIPEEGDPSSPAEKFIQGSRKPGSTARTVLIVIAAFVGLIVLAGIASSGPWGGAWGGGGWLLLLASGALVLWLVTRQPSGAPPNVPAGVVPTPVSTPDGTPAASATDTAVEPTGYAHGGYGGYPGYATPVPTPTPPAPPTPRSYLGLATVSLALLSMGVLGMLSISGALAIPAVVTLSVGLGVLGLGLLVGAFVGRARWLILIAIPLLMVTALVALIPANIGTRLGNGIGDRSWTPTTTAQAAGPYKLSIGSAQLDLTQLVLPTDPSAVVPVKASLGMGDLQVTVPEGVKVIVIATVGLGAIDIEGLPTTSGQDRSINTAMPGAVDEAAPTIELTADVAIGNLEVSRA